MKKLIIPILVLLSIIPLSARGRMPEGSSNIEEGMVISVDNLESISTSANWHLNIIEGNREELTIDKTGHSRGWVKYDRGELDLGILPGVSLNNRKNYATLTVLRLPDYLKASSSSHIESDLPYRGDEITIKSSSSGSISLASLEADKVYIAASSSARINIGRVNSLETRIKLSSSGKLEIQEGSTEKLESTLSSSARCVGEDFLVLESLDVTGSSSSRQEFSVSDDVTARGSLSSSADLVLHGNPSARAIQGIRTSSSGRVSIR